jgi:ABC-type Co2+ transport system permease subunit
MLDAIGAICFGIVVGWITYRTIRRQKQAVNLSDIAAVLAAIGGAAVTTLFTGSLFSYYAIGLMVGFFGYLALGSTVLKNTDWLGGAD